MVSYKKLYEELLAKNKAELELNQLPFKTGFTCPLCKEYEIVQIGSEFLCPGDGCKYDKTDYEIFMALAELRNYERVEE